MISCPREKELSQVLKDGTWPAACDPELRAHVHQCRSCSDLALLTQTFRKDRMEATQAARIDPPDLLWWRAQLRRRNDAVQRISKPIALAQRFALLVNLVAACGFVVWQWRHRTEWLSWLTTLRQSSTLHLESLLSSASLSTWNLTLFACAFAAIALLSGVALYLASDKP